MGADDRIGNGPWHLADRSEAESTTLRELLDRYEREVTPRKRSAEREKSFITTWRQTHLAARMVSTIRGSDVALLRDDWLKEMAPASVLRRLQMLSHVFNTARKEWGMESLVNPVGLITKPSPNNERERRVAPEELEFIIAATGSKYLPALLRIAVQSAVRRGELISLLWEHVRLGGDAPHLHLPLTKNGDARNVPLLLEVVEAIREWRKAVVPNWKPKTRARSRCAVACSPSGPMPSPVRSGALVSVRGRPMRPNASRPASLWMPSS